MNWQRLITSIGSAVRGGRRIDPESPGVAGERLAASWLKKNGFRIVERNLRVGDDEADLVATDPDRRTVVIVEVKTRTDSNSMPEERIDRQKQYRLARLAANLQKRPPFRDRPIRFDVVSVNLPVSEEPRVRHIPGAFESPF